MRIGFSDLRARQGVVVNVFNDLLTASSVADPTKADAVKAVTKVS